MNDLGILYEYIHIVHIRFSTTRKKKGNRFLIDIMFHNTITNILN